MESLVSVIISTYNSSLFIVETLESVSNQTWKEIELVITDDFSGDDTAEVCTKWLEVNQSRFTNTALLTSKINTGVSANANRGLNSATGEWVKFLGADDTLMPSCIEDNMRWLALNTGVNVLFSQIEVYRDTFDPQNFLERTPGVITNSASLMSIGRSAASQYKMLLLGDRIHYSPSVFLRRETIISVGGFDERFRLLEDYPLWLNLTGTGHKLWFMDKVTVNYRRHRNAINNTGIDYLINPNYFRSEEFRKIYTYPFLPRDIRYSQRFSFYVSQLFRYTRLNRNSRTNRFLLLLLSAYLNPFRYYIYLRKKLCKNIINDEFYL